MSTVYVESLGYALTTYEGGFFASFFVHAGLIYVYAVVYVLVVVGIAYVFWVIKNRVLDPSKALDKVFFVAVVIASCYAYVTLTATFIGNLFLPHVIHRGINMSSVTGIICLGAILSLVFYIRGDVSLWLRSSSRNG